MSTPAPPAGLSFPRDIYAKLSPYPYLLAHLEPATSTAISVRASGRRPHECRTPHINNGSLTHAEGSAVVRIGDTTVVCGVRGEILLASQVAGYRLDSEEITTAQVDAEARELHLLVPNIELATGCSPHYMPDHPPSSLAQSLSARIYSLLHSSRIVPGEDLRIYAAAAPELEEPAKVKAFWTLYIDILFISLDGNPFDAAWAAVISALHDVRLPQAHWDPDLEQVLCQPAQSMATPLHLRGMPIALTAAIFCGRDPGLDSKRDAPTWLLVDPDALEESLCTEFVSIVVDATSGTIHIVGLSKVGGPVVGPSQMAQLLAFAEERWVQLRSLLKSRLPAP
ncbi:BgTH12-01303 [Blumeria graminis f. sp. triticale]|uniref:BgTH12-01303 n=1 Tax=Blumeria graminis f. sp. triticale TaxID=1689686 RepID=A0A9W4D817_BLUGR|nr:BgTH12-01303 [Blumeria graminis f. sp. triticale]